MRIIDFLRDIFNGKETVYLKEKIESQKFKLEIELFFVEIAINMIAGLIAKCEFKTFLKNEAVKKDEYYLWNIEPNVNQNSSEFFHKLIYKLFHENEVLVVESNGQLLIADGFSRTQYALFPDAFSCVTCGNFTFTNKTFSMNDVLYFKLNNENIRGLLSRLMTGYSELLDMAIGKYKRSGGRKGVARIEKMKNGDKDHDQKVDDLFNLQFKKYFNNENAVVTLPKGVEYEEKPGETKKSVSEINDVVNITKESISRVAQALRMPPALLQGNVVDVDKIIDELLTICIDPLVNLLQTEINRKKYGKAAYLAGSYLKIDTTCIKHIDIFGVAVQADKLISDGLYNVDELRTKLGDMPLDTWWSKTHWMTKNYAEIDSLKGGDTNGETNLDDQTIS